MPYLRLCDVGIAEPEVKPVVKHPVKPTAVVNLPMEDVESCLLAVQKNPEAIKHIKDEFKTKEVCEAVVPFFGIEKYLPEEYKNLFDKFYEERGYVTFGPFKIHMKWCIKTYPCKHAVIREPGGPSQYISSRTIFRMLEPLGIPFPHWKPRVAEQSVAEQSVAEQSVAEQSVAEQSVAEPQPVVEPPISTS